MLKTKNSNNTAGRDLEIIRDDFTLKAYVSPFNRRVRIVDYKGPFIERAARKLRDVAGSYKFVTKIYGKVKKKDYPVFEKRGFIKEAEIPGYFNGKDAVVVGYYLDDERLEVSGEIKMKEEEIEEKLKDYSPTSKTGQLPEGYRIKLPSTGEDFEKLAKLYDRVFETYPFPITNPDYLEQTAASHILYAIIYNENDELVAAASAEMDLEHRNSEMTDFATLPSERGKGLASILLAFLEKEVEKIGIKSLYTIARARSAGMNMVFKKHDYRKTGKLINNCCICGDFENMAVWCKNLSWGRSHRSI